MYIGTSSLRAGLLVEYGWQSSLPERSLEDARQQAVLHAAVDGGIPVVLEQFGDETGSTFDVFEVGEVGGETAQERLGFSETAGLASILAGILDAAHSHVRNAIDIGMGHSNVELPSLRDITHAHDVAKHHIQRLSHSLTTMKNVHKAAHKAANKVGKFGKAVVKKVKKHQWFRTSKKLKPQKTKPQSAPNPSNRRVNQRWFKTLSPAEQLDYLRLHKNSKFKAAGMLVE